MNVLFVADPYPRWKLATDTTALMLRETCRRGNRAAICVIEDLYLDADRPMARVRSIVPAAAGLSFELGEPEPRALEDFAVIHLRTDPPFDLPYYLATLVLEMAARNSLVLNDPVALRGINEKLSVLRFPDLICENLVSADPDAIEAFVHRVGGKAVLKPLYRCSGQGVLLLDARGPLRTDITAALADNRGHVMLQRYLPGVVEGETRLIVFAGRVAGWLAKVPASGGFLSNLDFGATVNACAYTDREERVMARVGPFLDAHGVLFAAVDVIDGYLSEINITSPGLLHEVNLVNGTRIEVELEDLITARHEERAHGSSDSSHSGPGILH